MRMTGRRRPRQACGCGLTRRRSVASSAIAMARHLRSSASLGCVRSTKCLFGGDNRERGCCPNVTSRTGLFRSKPGLPGRFRETRTPTKLAENTGNDRCSSVAQLSLPKPLVGRSSRLGSASINSRRKQSNADDGGHLDDKWRTPGSEANTTAGDGSERCGTRGVVTAW
jgi:hypothetical protein